MTIEEPLAVPAHEEVLTEAELVAAEKALTARVEELRIELAEAELELDERISESVAAGVPDATDQGSNAAAREHETLLTHHVAELLRQTEHALTRIAEGRYSVCETCGEPIGRLRLEAFPRATMCLSCKQRERH